MRIKAKVKADDGLPGLRVRVHKPQVRMGTEGASTSPSPSFVDIALKEAVDTEIIF